jgi:hypothetical protein
MMRGQVFVRGRTKDDRWGNIDVLDLDDESFRAFVVEMLIRAGLVCSLNPDDVPEPEINYQERVHE